MARTVGPTCALCAMLEPFASNTELNQHQRIKHQRAVQVSYPALGSKTQSLQRNMSTQRECPKVPVAQVYHADTPCLAEVFHCPQCASRPASDVNACYSTPDPAQMRRHALACGRPATLALDSLSSSQGSLPQRPSFACRTCTPQASFANSALLSQHRRLTHQRKVQVTYAKLQVTQSIERDPQTLRE